MKKENKEDLTYHILFVSNYLTEQNEPISNENLKIYIPIFKLFMKELLKTKPDPSNIEEDMAKFTDFAHEYIKGQKLKTLLRKIDENKGGV